MSQEEGVIGEYMEIDGKYVWASEEEKTEAIAQGLIDYEGLTELEFGPNEEAGDDGQ